MQAYETHQVGHVFQMRLQQSFFLRLLSRMSPHLMLNFVAEIFRVFLNPLSQFVGI